MAGALAVALVVAACGGSGDSPEGGDEAPADDAVAETLKVGVSLATDSYDPHLTIQAAAALLYPAYDTLTVMNEAAEVMPSLATAWEQVEPTVWRLTLRDDVVFHDGSAFDAEVVKKNFERGMTLEASPYVAMYSAMESVTVVDEYTVDITFDAPYPSFPVEIASVGGAMVSGQAIDEGLDLTTTIVGSGGWVYDPDASTRGSLLVFRAFEDYWDPDAVRAQTVEYHIISDDNARFNAFQSGQVDVMGHLQPGQIDQAESSGATVSEVPIELNLIVIADRTGKIVPQLQDERVRRAIALLIDRDAINAAAYSGGGNPEIGGFMPPSTRWHDDELDEVYRTADVDEAKRLLAAAGYPDGFSLQIASVDLVQQRLTAMSQLLAEGGIDLQVTTVPPGTLAQQNRAGNYPILTGTSRNVEPWSWYATYVSESGPYNGAFGATDMRDLDAKADQAAETDDPDEAKAIWDDIQAEVLERGFAFPLMWTSQRAAVSGDVDGEVELRPSETTPRPHGLAVTQ